MKNIKWENLTIHSFLAVVKIASLLVAKVAILRGWITK